jgi:hypothetical protein
VHLLTMDEESVVNRVIVVPPQRRNVIADIAGNIGSVRPNKNRATGDVLDGHQADAG